VTALHNLTRGANVVTAYVQTPNPVRVKPRLLSLT